jgi:hypothetical protein
MRTSLSVVVLVVVVLTAATAASSHRAAGTVSSSRLVGGGDFRVTATVASPVKVGHPLDVTFRIRNVSKQTRKIQLDYATSLWFIVHSRDGTRYDTRRAYELTGSLGGPMRIPTTLRPGATVTRRGVYLRVHWSGPLEITPGVGQAVLRPLQVAVISPGHAPSDRAAVAEVVAATGHLLDHCRPASPAVPVTGTIEAPDHSAPSMSARCSITLRRERGFVVAQVLVAVPVRYRGVHLQPPYEQLTWPQSGRNAEMIGWQFVVTRKAAISVGSTSTESTEAGKSMAPDWQWTTSGWEPHPGSSRCGGTGGGGGGYVGPLVEFVSVCAR